MLVAHWDKLRRALFGGGAGTTVSGQWTFSKFAVQQVLIYLVDRP